MRLKLFFTFITSFALIGLIFSTSTDLQARVTDVPYTTYSTGLDGSLVHTATAYEGTFILNRNFDNPQDIFIDHNDKVYIADSGNSRVFVYDPATREEYVIGEDILDNPTGIFVDRQNDIYIADSGNNLVYWFNAEGDLIHTYDRPEEAFFGDDAPYLPRKVIVDRAKNVYVITDRGTNGIIQMDSTGEFLGYYGVNRVQLSFSLYLQRLFMSQEQRDRYASLTPRPTTNFDIDNKGLIYTVINGEYLEPLKKLNIVGNNVLSGDLLEEPNYRDIFVDGDGLIYAISNNTDAKGIISVLDNHGNLIFQFAERQSGSLKMGQFENPSGIAVDSQGDIWALDGGGNNVQVFTKTEFGNLVLTAIEAHSRSDYDTSQTLFEEVIRQNAMFSLAHSSLGRAYHRDGDIYRALESYQIVGDLEGYSEVFWEVRDEWIARNLTMTLVLLVGGVIAYKQVKKNKEKLPAYKQTKEFVNKQQTTKWYHEVSLIKRMLYQPLDVIYEIKYRQSVRIRTALIMYFVFTVLMIAGNFYVQGYLFKGNTDDIILAFEIMKWLLPLLLLGVANHLMNSLQSGEAFYRDLFIGFIYATAPILIFKLPIDIVSNVLTYNEAFLFQLANIIIYGWTLVNLVLLIKELNNYKPGQLIVNIALTLFTMLILVILYLVVNVLTSQLFTFIRRMIQEVF